MKKNLLALVIFFTLLTACEKDEGIKPEKKEVELPSLPNYFNNNNNNNGNGDANNNGNGGSKNPVVKTTYETEQLLNEEYYWLNSATYLGVNKITRIAIPIRIPKNAVKIIYSITTTSGETPVTELKLGAQLASLLVDATGTLGILANQIKIPGSKSPGRVEVYLLDDIYKKYFLNKDDSIWEHYISGSRDSFVRGTIEVENSEISYFGYRKNLIDDRLMYICLRNPRTTHGVNITIEASAIIEKEIIVYE